MQDLLTFGPPGNPQKLQMDVARKERPREAPAGSCYGTELGAANSVDEGELSLGIGASGCVDFPGFRGRVRRGIRPFLRRSDWSLLGEGLLMAFASLAVRTHSHKQLIVNLDGVREAPSRRVGPVPRSGATATANGDGRGQGVPQATSDDACIEPRANLQIRRRETAIVSTGSGADSQRRKAPAS